MFDAIKLRILQGDPIVHDVRNPSFPELFRGLPVIDNRACPDGCQKCADVCPVKAIRTNPLTIDLGKCTFCPLCEKICPEKIIHFTHKCHLAVTDMNKLLITAKTGQVSPELASQKIRSYFKKSLKLRQVSAGGCNGCELELNALGNVNFDMGRFGIEFTASPRHADGIVITGPISGNMSKALEICHEAVPNPRIVILTGACAISGGIFQESTELQRKFLLDNKIDLFIPGCPPHPLTFINGLLDWLGK